MRVGVLGTGRIAAYRADALRAHPEVDELLVGSRDRTRALLSYEQVMDARPDALVISTATSEHAALIAAGAAHGLPMLCEKPISLTLHETREALAAVERAGAELQVAFQRRFDAGWRVARDLVSGGGLGTLYSMRLNSHDREPSPEQYIPGSGGLFRDLHVHDFDCVRWVTGERVASAYAVGSARHWERFRVHDDIDSSAITLVLEGGAPALISGARHDPRGYDARAELFGSEDSVAVGWDDRMALRSLEPGGPPPSERPYDGFLDRFDAAFQAEMQGFLDMVAGRGTNECPGTASLEALRVAIACERSLREGRPVRVAEIE